MDKAQERKIYQKAGLEEGMAKNTLPPKAANRCSSNTE